MIGWATAGMAAGVIGAHAQAKAQQAAIDEQRRQFELSRSGKFLSCDGGQVYWADPPRDDGLSVMEREHKARMAAEHAETMRQAKVGTWLLVAFVVAAGFAVANLLGGIG